MRSEFIKQLNLSIIIVLICSVLNTLFKHWILSSIGFCTCGMLWFIHPVKMNDIRSEESQYKECRIAGIILFILIIISSPGSGGTSKLFGNVVNVSTP